MLNKQMAKEVIRYAYRYFGGIAKWQQVDNDYINIVTNDDEEREFFMETGDDGKNYIIEQLQTGVDINGDRQYQYCLVWQEGS